MNEKDIRLGIFITALALLVLFGFSNDKYKKYENKKIEIENINPGYFLKQDSKEQQLLTLLNYENISDVCYSWLNSRYKKFRIVEKSDIFKFNNGQYGQRITIYGTPSDMNSYRAWFQYIFVFSEYKLLSIDLAHEMKEVDVNGERTIIQVEKKLGATK